MAQAFDQFVFGSHPDLQSTAIRSNTVFFLYKSWLQIDGHLQADRKRWSSTFPVLLWFEVKGKVLNLRVEVGPLQSRDNDRAALVNSLRNRLGGPRPKAGGKGNGETYTRIKRFSTAISEDPTIEDLVVAMEKTWKEAAQLHIHRTVQEAVESATPLLSTQQTSK